MAQAYPKLWRMMLDATGILPVVVKSVDRIHDYNWSMEKSTHDHYEIVYMRKGSAIFDISGKRVGIEPNEIVLIKPNQPHSFKVPEQSRCEFFVLQFAFVESNRKNTVTVSPDEFMIFLSDTADKAFVKCRVGLKSELANVLHRICLIDEKADEEDNIIRWLLFMELFVYISRAIREQGSRRNKEMDVLELTKEAKAFIDTNYMINIGLSEIANYVFLSQSYFARIFKDVYKISPIQYLLRVRVCEAKKLLENTNLKIGDIAIRVGFSTQQRFNEVFKKHTKTSPLEYRRNAKAQKLNS